jgi:Na+/citrate or Na+/malate symporter
LVAHYNLLLLLLLNSLHILLELLLAAHGLPILKACHLVVVLALKLLCSAHLGRAAITLMTLIQEAIVWRILRASLPFECGLGCIDYGNIFEKLTATFLLVIVLRNIDTRLLHYRTVRARKSI